MHNERCETRDVRCDSVRGLVWEEILNPTLKPAFRCGRRTLWVSFRSFLRWRSHTRMSSSESLCVLAGAIRWLSNLA